ncbi:MAG: hypothetical protein ACLTVG_01775 [Coprococcus sp.]
MASFVYETVKTTSMKIAGVIDTDRMIIEVDGEEKKLSTLLQEFNNYEIEFNIKTKDEEELDDPVDSEDEYNE